jgi:hypothetical protein
VTDAQAPAGGASQVSTAAGCGAPAGGAPITDAGNQAVVQGRVTKAGSPVEFPFLPSSRCLLGHLLFNSW